MSSPPERDQLFISYSHVDRQWVDRLQKTIQPMVRSHGLRLWDDSQIQPGDKWREEIETALAAAKVALLLVSPDFLASEFVSNSELPQLLAAAEEEGLRILWVPVRPSLVRRTPISAYQGLGDPGRPLARMDPVEQEEALVKIALAIEQALAHRQNSPSAAAETRGDSAGGPRQVATPRSGSSVLPGADRQAVAAERSGAVQPEVAQPEVAQPEVAQTEAAEPSASPVSLLHFPTSTCLLRQEGGRWSMELRPLQVEGYREDLGEGVALTMVKIPAGSFLMGSPEDEPERLEREGPQHDVTLGSFFMAQTPITQAQWRAVAGWQKVERDLTPDPSNFKGANRPVERVSWFDALEFCRRLSQRTGQRYGLPSEAQWEYACRAGSTTPFHFGATLTPELANYNDYNGNHVYGNGPTGTCREQTIDVASFPANGWGLHDLHGNVWEWCADHWHESYNFAPGDDQPWLIPAAADDELRLLRGGSWYCIPRDCRSAYRGRFRPVFALNFVGFRVVCLPQKPAAHGNGSSDLPGGDRQVVPAARSGAVQPEVAQSEAAQTEAAEPSASPVSLQHFPTSTCLLRQEGGRWSMELRPLQVEGYREELGEGVALTMVTIPAGNFLMGSPEEEPGRSDDEGPQHEVTLGSFFMAQTPITQAQWRAVAGWQKVERDLEPYPSAFKGANRPVEQVNWFDALEFCRRLSQRTGQRYGLPSEAQWEYACRAGSTTPFNFGETLITELANYDGNYIYGQGPKGIFRQQTTDVGSFPANAWGLQDMHGNVREWCLDRWHPSLAKGPTNGSAWQEPSPQLAKEYQDWRLLRGGSWCVIPRGCRSASRFSFPPGLRFNDHSFRVCCLPQD
jgi:formylglycine-generating enzyme required for sulfatase activity